MASVFVLLEAFNRKEAAALGFFPCATASFFNDCRILAADLDKSQRLILYFERNSRTFSVMETVAYMQLPIKVSSKIIS